MRLEWAGAGRQAGAGPPDIAPGAAATASPTPVDNGAPGRCPVRVHAGKFCTNSVHVGHRTCKKRDTLVFEWLGTCTVPYGTYERPCRTKLCTEGKQAFLEKKHVFLQNEEMITNIVRTAGGTEKGAESLP